MTIELLDETTAGGSERPAGPPVAAIRDRVLDALGRPSGLLRVEVRRLWEGRYRVNVYTGSDVASATVAHSFFVVADAAGRIASSTPKLPRPR